MIFQLHSHEQNDFRCFECGKIIKAGNLFITSRENIFCYDCFESSTKELRIQIQEKRRENKKTKFQMMQ